MHFSTLSSTFSLLSLLTLVAASPQRLPHLVRAVTELNEEATAEAHQRDATATRAFSSVEIQTGDGQCLFVDELSGDFRANLLPVQIKPCDGSVNQQWDIITAGLHNDRPGTMLVVSAHTQGCLNYDPRRQPGDQVNIFSCGGRAAGEGTVTTSQLFQFAEVSAGPLSLEPLNEEGTCFTATGERLDRIDCNTSDELQFFTFGDAVAGAPGGGDDNAGGVDDGLDDGEVVDPVDPLPPTSTIELPSATVTATATATATAEATETVIAEPEPTETAVVEPPTETAAPAPTGTGRPGRGRGRGRGRGGRPGRRPVCDAEDDD